MSNRAQTTSCNVLTSAWGGGQGDVRWPHIRETGEKCLPWWEVRQENFIAHWEENFLPQSRILNLEPFCFLSEDNAFELSLCTFIACLWFSNTKSHVHMFLERIGPQSRSTLQGWVCVSFFLIPLLSLFWLSPGLRVIASMPMTALSQWSTNPLSMSVSTSFLRNHLSKLDVKHETVRKLLLNAIYNISEGRMESPGLTATSALNKGLEGPAVRFFCLKDDHHVCSQIKTRSVLTGKQTMKN